MDKNEPLVDHLTEKIASPVTFCPIPIEKATGLIVKEPENVSQDDTYFGMSHQIFNMSGYFVRSD
jgi:hypothetical protein